MMRSLFTLLTLCCLTALTAQQQPDRCHTHEMHLEMMEDPDFAEQFHSKIRMVNDFLEERAEARQPVCDNEIIIPVAVHFQNTGIDMTCAVDMALDQIRILNEDFSATNADITEWEDAQPANFPAIQNGESCLQFCLATLNHPAGFGLTDGDYAVTVNETTGDNDAQWSGYLNFFVRDLGGGLLGYSPLGGNGNGDGITVTIDAFSSISCGGNTINGTYNLGRTATHELGHYFLLEHPFDGGCGGDDNVADTPQSDTPAAGCPALGWTTCTDPVLWMSYMDYSDDACLYMFSSGQVDRMDTYAQNSLTNLSNNSVTVCQEAACIDYEVNVSETDESCPGNDGQIDIQVVVGTEPYQYSINGGASTQNFPTFDNLTDGNYDVVVTDGADCVYEETVFLSQENTTMNIISIQNTFCGNDSGMVELDVPEPGNFEYSLDGVNWQTSPIFDLIPAGTYNAQARNTSGCQAFKTVDVLDFNDLGISVDDRKNVNCFYADNGMIRLSLSGGEEPIIYRIDDDPNTTLIPEFTGLAVGEHTIFIEDARECEAEYIFELFRDFSSFDDDCPCTVYVPSAMTPNGDDVNETLEVVASCPFANYKLQIFDRWGQVVFETTDPEQKWNAGTGEYFVMDGMYFYKVELTWGTSFGSSNNETITGSVMVIR